jgi:FkbM family methyltransferase
MLFKFGPLKVGYYSVNMVVVWVLIQIDSRKLRAIKHPYVLVKVLDKDMFLDTADRGIGVDLFIAKEREKHFATHFRNNILKAGQVVIDIGANIGYYALMEASVADTVYAIEPISKNMKLLQKNIIMNNISNIKTFKTAIGNMTGYVNMGVSHSGNLCSIRIAGYATERVPITTLDNFVKVHNIKPDVIRMDVEGYCTEIIEGGIRTLRNNNVIICMELHPVILSERPYAYLKMIGRLQQLGYEIAFASREIPCSIINHPLFPIMDTFGRIAGFKSGQVNIKLNDLLKPMYQDGLHNAVEIILRKVK